MPPKERIQLSVRSARLKAMSSPQISGPDLRGARHTLEQLSSPYREPMEVVRYRDSYLVRSRKTRTTIATVPHEANAQFISIAPRLLYDLLRYAEDADSDDRDRRYHNAKGWEEYRKLARRLNEVRDELEAAKAAGFRSADGARRAGAALAILDEGAENDRWST